MSLSAAGVLFAVLFVIFACYRGYSPIVVAPVSGLIICLTGGLKFGDFVTTYGGGVGSMVSSVIITYMLCLIFAQLMTDGKGAYSIAYWLAGTLGPKYACIVLVIAGGILTVGGMTIGAYLVLFPMGLVLCSKANYSEDILLACCTAGGWTFGIVMPMAPSIHNSIASQYLETSTFAGLVPGLIGCAFLIIFDCIYLQWQVRHWQKKGRVFTAWDKVPNEEELGTADYPPVWRAFIPIVVILVLYNVFQFRIQLALLIGCICVSVLEHKAFGKGILKTWEAGALKALKPMCSMSSMSGIGKCVAATPFFGSIIAMMETSTMSPYFLAALSGSIFAFCLGSASSACSTSLSALAPIFQNYAAQGYNMGNIHRLLLFGAVGPDSLPQSGTIAAAVDLFQTTYKKSYFPAFITTVAATAVAAYCVVLPLCMLGLH